MTSGSLEKIFLHSYFLCVFFYRLFFSQYEACCFPSQLIISANCAPSHGEKKNAEWFSFSDTEKKRSNVLALVKNDNFSNISVSIMCRGWWPTDHRELPESLWLSAFFFLYARIKDRWNYTPELYSQAQVILKLSELVFYEKIMANCKQYWWKFPFIKTIYF